MQNPKAGRIMGVVLIAVVAVVVWLLRDNRATGPTPAVPGTKPMVRITEPTPEDPASHPLEPRRESLSPMGKSRLDSFFIPAVSGNNVPVDEALERLGKAFDKACLESREDHPPLTLEVRGDPGVRLTFSFAGTTFSSNLRHLAALAGMEVMQKQRQRHAFVLVPAKPEVGVAEITIEDPVTFARGLREMVGTAARAEWEPRLVIRLMPSEETPPTLEEWREILRQSGLCEDAGYECRQGERQSITITASAADLRRIKSAKALVKESGAQLKVTPRILASDGSIPIPREVLDEPQWQKFVREMAPKSGTDLMTTPSVTTRQNQSAPVEIIREHDAGGWIDWTGIKFSLTARLVGWKIAGNPQMEIRANDQVNFSAQGRKDILIKSGETAVMPLVSPEKAGVACFITLQRVDAPDRPLDEPREPENESLPTLLPPLAEGNTYPPAQAVPGKPGMVFSPHSNKIVDVNGLPSGTLLAEPEFPLEEKKYFRVP